MNPSHPLVGLWRSAAGTFGAVMSDTLWFGGDGRGWLESHSGFGAAPRIGFAWRPAGDGVIEILDDVVDANEPPEWQRVRWEPCEVQTDVGTLQAVRERGSQGFWLAAQPLTRIGSGEDG
jgi:hypothetical protein